MAHPEKRTKSHTSWIDLLETPEEQATVARLVDTIQQQLTGIGVTQSPHRVRLCAQSMLSSLKSSYQQYHKGASDRQKLRQFRKSMNEAARSLRQLSPWAREAVVNAMRQSGDGEYVESGLQTFALAIRNVGAATQHAEKWMAQGPIKGRVNWEAVALVGEARKCWQALTGRVPPERSLNEATPFGDFLQTVLDTLGIQSNAKAAYKSWRKHEDDQIRR